MRTKQENIEIKIIKNWPKEEIVNLYKAGGWWKKNYDPSQIEFLIKGSYIFVVAVNTSTNKAVGMGRILSDGISDAYIQDLVVLKESRGKGIGKKIANYLINHCKKNGINWIGLISEPKQDGFYLSIGFSEMANYKPMKYQNED